MQKNGDNIENYLNEKSKNNIVKTKLLLNWIKSILPYYYYIIT